MAHHLTHPDSGQTIEVEADSVQMYLSQGWLKPTDAKKAKKAAQASDSADK